MLNHTSNPVPADNVIAVRRFNRFHTRLIGVLNDRMPATEFSLPQLRVFYEIASAPSGKAVSGAELGRELGLDAGYISRLIAGLERMGLVTRTPSKDNGKRLDLEPSEAGRAKFAEIVEATNRQVTGLLSPLSDGEQRQLVGAMQRIERLLGNPSTERIVTLRDPEPGDMGFITHRQMKLYANEYGWDWTFEALVAEIVSDFIQRFDPAKERCWIAECEGEVAGSVFIVREDDETAKLRLLYVEDWARGLGIGSRLVAECIRFARAHGYGRIVLWTNDILVSARKIYQAAGFRLIDEEKHRSFGKDLVGQHWQLDL